MKRMRNVKKCILCRLVGRGCRIQGGSLYNRKLTLTFRDLLVALIGLRRRKTVKNLNFTLQVCSEGVS
jgi:hypothetical protein